MGLQRVRHNLVTEQQQHKKAEEDQSKKSCMIFEMKDNSSIVTGRRGQNGANVCKICQGRRDVPLYGCCFPWEIREHWRKMENSLSLPVQLKFPHDSVQAFVHIVHTHEEGPLQSLLLSSWPQTGPLSLERDQMGRGCPTPVFMS